MDEAFPGTLSKTSVAPSAFIQPWMTDERRYPVIAGLADDGSPSVRWLMRREFPRSVVRSKWGHSVFKWRLDNGWRCFISGVQCLWMPERWYDEAALRKLVPWALSWDHLVPVHLSRRHGAAGADAVNRLGNQAVVGMVLNHKCGHIPLALKLLHRQVLRDEAYDRDAPTHETLATIRRRIIGTEDGFIDEGRYPWQPWVHPEGAPSRLRAEAFMREMDAYEIAFLSVPWRERDAYVDAFSWRW